MSEKLLAQEEEKLLRQHNKARKMIFENVQKSPARIFELAQVSSLSHFARTMPARRLERFSNHISSPLNNS